MKRVSEAFKGIIAIIAILNIAAMMIFEYGLPSLASAASIEQISEADVVPSQQSPGTGGSVGTIEAVEKEEANKETEAAETALAKVVAEEEEVPAEPEEQTDPDAPFLELTNDHIYLKLGDRFNYMSYIKTMEDVDGSDLSRYIHLDKDVNTWESGEIELTYRITSVITGKSTSKVLRITITE